MVDTPESLREFIRKYNFPEDVEVRYCSKSKAILSRGEGRLVIPLIVIVKGGDKIPISCSPIFFATLRKRGRLSSRLRELVPRQIHCSTSAEDLVFKKKRQLINSINLNMLLRSLIYPHTDSQHHVAISFLDTLPLDGVLVTDRVRPWREGHRGKALLPEKMKHWAKWDDDSLLLNMKREAIVNILDVMNKVSKLERLQSEVEENTKTIMERLEALEKELQEARKALADKDAKLKGYKVADDAKLQDAYY
nr:hypothetical protein CFP56_59533 [Quercus suber]